jgi:hypothetical protein
MKRYWLAVFILFVMLGKTALAQTPGDRRFGLGVVLGAPTAITGKYWISKKSAFDFGISAAPAYWVLIYGDYLWEYPDGFGHSSKFVSQLVPYIGVGGGLFSWNPNDYADRPWGWRGYNNSGVGLYARVPFGVEWVPQKPPLGVFIEISPGIAIFPGMWVTLDIGIGVRYYF